MLQLTQWIAMLHTFTTKTKCFIGGEFEMASKMLSKRAITPCKIILQLTIVTNNMYAILDGLMSGGLLSLMCMG